ncbi:MAG: SUMF1/EgtB/PvdO family nonheme iron enzyme, partial [Prevotella sp.]|nr:SUMF1/EgtB/PvdO family nonheme iron enzyme [Prevotella sp.]
MGMNQSPQDRIIQNLINNMVYVAGGTFTMGATTEQGSDADSDEKPAHRVTLSSFSIGKYEVTQ